MKLYVYRSHGNLKGLQLRKKPMADEDLEGPRCGEDESEYYWTLIGTMEVSSLEGEELVEALERSGCLVVWATSETFWNH